MNKTAVKLNLSNCPKTKKPTVLKIGMFPTLNSGLSQLSLVDTDENFTELVVRLFDSVLGQYRNLTTSDFKTTADDSTFTFSGSYTTDVYQL
jgi:hypothetical protein